MNYENISLKIAENGWILDYCEKVPKEGEHGMFAERKYCQKVFKMSEGKSALDEMQKMSRTTKEFPMDKEMEVKDYEE